MKVELDALEKIGTWELIHLPLNIKPMGCIWVYKIMQKSDGNIKWFKVSLVAKCYNQIKGLECSYLFTGNWTHYI